MNLRRRDLCAKCLLVLTIMVIFMPLGRLLALPSNAADFPKMSGPEQVYLYNVDYDEVLYHSEYADKTAKDITIYPASSVKLMTGLIACEQLASRKKETINVSSKMLDGVKGNNMGLKVGERVIVEDMLYGLLTNCANDAAQVLAVLISGSVSSFVNLMNDKARELGMYNTNYTNPTGMHDDKMVTTLRDTVLLAKACFKNDYLMALTSEIKHVMDKTNKTEFRNLYNRNNLISTFYNTSSVDYRYNGIRGMNAGFTPQGGYCVISSATRNNLSYICIVMNGVERADDTISSYLLTRDLYDWAFSSYTRKDILSSGTIVTEMPVSLSSTVDFVQLKADLGENEVLTCYLPVSTDIQKEITYSWFTFEESLQAPVKRGTVVGTVTVLYNEEVIGTANLVTSTDIDRSDFLYMLSKIKDFTTTKFFIVTIISFVVLFALYIIAEATKEERAVKHKYTNGSTVSISISPNIRRKPRTAVRRPSNQFTDKGATSSQKQQKPRDAQPPVNPSRR